MEQVLAHLQENATGYGIGAVCLLPVIFVTRKYSVPLILYIVEFAIYATALHVVVWCVVGLARWFKEQSSMKALRPDGKPADAPDWGTPLLEFWDKTQYKPHWLWIAEVVCLVIILALMWRYRPMKIQRKAKRATQEFGKSTARSGQTGKVPPGGKGGKFGAGRSGRGR